MEFTNFSQRGHADPDVMVRLTVEGGREVTGFIDARQQRDGVWEAWVDCAYVKTTGTCPPQRVVPHERTRELVRTGWPFSRVAGCVSLRA